MVDDISPLVPFPLSMRIFDGVPWEQGVGYARAVRVGAHVFVSGTTAPGPDAYAQAKAALAKIEAALKQAGAELRHVVRTRIYVTDIAQWEAVGRAHAEVFGTIRPAATMVEVRRLIAPELLVEIEADAVVE
jgi:enamine deaminase RidA (YjgF/YER057c/UK114 family)